MAHLRGMKTWRWGDAFLMRQSDVTYESLMARPAHGRLRPIPVLALPRWVPEGSPGARPVATSAGVRRWPSKTRARLRLVRVA